MTHVTETANLLRKTMPLIDVHSPVYVMDVIDKMETAAQLDDVQNMPQAAAFRPKRSYAGIMERVRELVSLASMLPQGSSSSDIIEGMIAGLLVELKAAAND